MKIYRSLIVGLSILGLIVIALIIGSIYQRDRNRTEFAQRMLVQRTLSMETVEELKKSIAVYERRIERHVADAAKNSTYWKLLAVRLQERGLHGDALEALEKAIYFNPEDPHLHYYTGVSAGIMAKSFHLFPGRDTSDRERYYTLAEDAFLRSIELDSRYQRPRYSLGVLYVFELNRPQDAVPHLERCLEISRNDVDTMFVLAGAYYMLERYQAAVDLYDRIITVTSDPQKRIDARNNREVIMDMIYG